MKYEYHVENEMVEQEGKKDEEMIVITASEQDGTIKKFIIQDIHFLDENDASGNNVTVDFDTISEESPSQDMLQCIMMDVLERSIKHAEEVVANESKGV